MFEIITVRKNVRNIRKNVNVHTDLRFATIAHVELDTPASEYEIRFYEIRKTTITLHRYPKLNAPTAMFDATQ